jgi:hypothetical protein
MILSTKSNKIYMWSTVTARDGRYFYAIDFGSSIRAIKFHHVFGKTMPHWTAIKQNETVDEEKRFSCDCNTSVKQWNK